jgi:hypothetical protein
MFSGEAAAEAAASSPPKRLTSSTHIMGTWSGLLSDRI